MNDDIRMAIEKNLPAAVGDVLKQRLIEADLHKVELSRIKSELEALSVKTASCEARLNKAQAELDAHVKLNVREALVTRREDVITLKENHAKERVDSIQSLLNTLFQNRSFQHNFHMSGQFPAGAASYPGGQPVQAPFNVGGGVSTP